MNREIKFRRTKTYDDELANIREFNPRLADHIEQKREYFERCLTTPPYRPAPGLNVEALEGKITRPDFLAKYPKLYSFRVNKQARVIFWCASSFSLLPNTTQEVDAAPNSPLQKLGCRRFPRISHLSNYQTKGIKR